MTQTEYQKPEQAQMDFTIYDIIRFYRDHARIFIVALGAIFIVSLTLFLVSTKQYQSSMDVLPPEMRKQNQNVAGGLAQALMGESSSSPEFSNFLTSLGSVQLGEKLMADPAIASVVFEEQWDAQTERWHKPSGLRPMLGRGLRSVFGLTPWAPPTAFDMRNYIVGHVNVSKVRDSRASRLAYKHRDPAFAKLFLKKVVEELDEILRAQKIETIKRENDELRGRFAQEQNSSVREYMVRWISENENKTVETESAEFFSFQVLDPISVNPQPVSPQPVFSIIISIIISIFGGVLVMAFYGVFRILRRNMSGT